MRGIFFYLIVFGHFVSYLNRLGNRNKYICFCFTRLISCWDYDFIIVLHTGVRQCPHKCGRCSHPAYISRETIANRGSGRKLVYRHFRGAASRLRRSKHSPNKNKATLTLTSFAQVRNWRLSYEMYACIHFAAFGLTVFARALCWSARLWKACKHAFRNSRLNNISTFIKMLSTYIL